MIWSTAAIVAGSAFRSISRSRIVRSPSKTFIVLLLRLLDPTGVAGRDLPPEYSIGAFAPRSGPVVVPFPQ
jgi:hypothetical protein